MADYQRTPRPCDTWTTAELAGYNIEVVSDNDIQSFFGVPELPTPEHISPIIWNNDLASAGPISKDEKNFFALLQDATYSDRGENAASNDFIQFLLGYLGYDDDPSYVLHTRKENDLLVCGKYVDATSDVAVLERNGYYNQYILLVQKDTYYHTGCPTHGPLIAKAIAAFGHNNAQRRHLPRLKSQTFPAMTIVGTSVDFYKITVTQALVEAVMGGIYPEETTYVSVFRPSLHMSSPYHGMVAVENRRVLFRCLVAFKQLIAAPSRE